MKFIRNLLLVIFLFLVLSHAYAAEPGDVVINELMWMGSNTSTADEWIELRNMMGEDIDLSGWDITKLSNGTEELMLTIPSGKVISAGGYFLISNYDRDNSKSLLDVDPDVVDTDVRLDNSKLQIKIYNGSWNNGGVLIDTADDGSGDPLAGDKQDKYSMERRAPPGDGTISFNWQTSNASVNWDSSATEKGTPKAPNSLDLTPPQAIDDLVAWWGDKDGEIILTWTSPTEDTAGGGKVSYYDVRYATFPFTLDNWNSPSVIEAQDEPIPNQPGEKETMIISGLKPGVIYYFGIRSGDYEGQISDIDEKTKENNQSFCVVKGEIKVKITEVSFASTNDWVELYNWGEEDIDISHFMLTDLDGTDSSLAGETVTLNPAQYAVIHWDDTGIDETDRTGDINGNGYIDLYVNDTGLSSTDDELVLMSAAINGDYIDAVCWSNLDGVYDNTDLKLSVDKSMWTTDSSWGENDCWADSDEVNSNSSLGRKPHLYEDTNSKGDWYLYATPTPGQQNLFLRIMSPGDGIVIEQTDNVQITPEVSLGDVESIEFMYRKKGARNWNYIAKKTDEPFSTAWNTTDIDIGTYELRLLANDSIYSSVTLVTLVKAEEPETRILVSPESITNNKDVIFEFSGEDNVTPSEKLVFLYKLDDFDWQEIGDTKQVILKNLENGKHNFSVKSKDEAGYEDTTPAMYSFTVDTSIPEVFVSLPCDGDRIAGNAVCIKTEYLDSDIEEIVFQYRLSDENWQDIGTVKEPPFNIYWDVSGLFNGAPCELTVKATDKAGNISDCDSSIISLIIDFDRPTYGGNKNLIEPDKEVIITTIDGIKIEIPAGVFEGGQPIEMTTIKLKPHLLNQSKHPDIKPTGIAMELLLSNNQHFLGEGKSAQITFYYSDDELGDIKEDTLRLFYWDEEEADWKLIGNSRVYPYEDCVRAQITHFSIYQIMGYTPTYELSTVYVFPNPCYYSGNKQVYFSKLPDTVEEISIYNLSGELVKKVSIDSINLDDTYWECDNESGEIVASGIYLCLIKTDSEQKIIKIAVIK